MTIKHNQKINRLNFNKAIGQAITVIWDNGFKYKEVIKSVSYNMYGTEIIFNREYTSFLPNFIEWVEQRPSLKNGLPFWSCVSIGKNKKVKHLSKGD